MEKQLTLQDGRIEEFGVRMAFFPTFTLIKMVEKMYEREGEEAFEMLFEAGKDHGHYIVEEVGKKNDIPKNRFVEETVESANVLGLGKIESEHFNPEGKILLKVTDSPFVEEIKKSEKFEDVDRPVDDMIRGMIHGIAEEIFDTDVESKEKMCEIQGDPHCLIEVRTKGFSKK